MTSAARRWDGDAGSAGALLKIDMNQRHKAIMVASKFRRVLKGTTAEIKRDHALGKGTSTGQHELDLVVPAPPAQPPSTSLQ
jgi:hypothetical protein